MRCWILATFLLAASTGFAGASPDSDALVKYGLIGSWAVDCKKPPADDNPFQVITPSNAGEPTRQLMTGNGNHTSPTPLHDVARVDADHLRFSFTQGMAVVTVTLVKEKGRIRPTESQTGDGQVVVKDGIVVRSGQQTIWLQKCPD
jgi:hypothetical protein